MRLWCVMPALAVWLQAASVVNAQTPLTLSDVYARARAEAPAIVSARLAMAEARGRLAGALLRLPSNPDLGISLGNRHGDRNTRDLELAMNQPLEPHGRRRARIDAANAAIRQASADVDETTRIALRETGSAFYRALHATEQLRLLTAAEALASGVLQIADRRFRAGDIAALDVNIAKGALARVRASREAASAALILALADLRQLLRLEGDIQVRGDLLPLRDVDRNALTQSAANRPELRALDAAVHEAEAEVALGRTFLKPDYGVGLQYKREASDHIVLGGLTVTLPLFSNGQELRAVGTARAARLRAELAAARARIVIEVDSTIRAYERRLEAIRVLQTEALPGLDDNEMLASRSFEEGQIGLPELLLIRREILDTRFEYLAALLEAALGRVDVDASAGVLP